MDVDGDVEARAYQVWRIDCDGCGEVIDLDDGDEPPEVCPNPDCGTPVRVA